MKYFSCVEGAAVTRYGTDRFIGARRTADKGMVFFPERVIAIPDDEAKKYVREYRNAVRNRVLVVRTEDDFNAAEKKIADENTKTVEAMEAVIVSENTEAEPVEAVTVSENTEAVEADQPKKTTRRRKGSKTKGSKEDGG